MAWVLTFLHHRGRRSWTQSGWLARRSDLDASGCFCIQSSASPSPPCCAESHNPCRRSCWHGCCRDCAGRRSCRMSQAVLLDINPPAHHARALAIWVMAVTVGPIIGPALGGWLTENYNWRWVFYINVPFGILSFVGILSAMSETVIRKSRFDFFGFSALSIGIGALQLMLDRGQLKDWFASTEIWIEAGVAGTSLYLFVVHMLTTTKPPFVSTALFKDRISSPGNVFIFIVGVVLFDTGTASSSAAVAQLSRRDHRTGDGAAKNRHFFSPCSSSDASWARSTRA